MAIFTARSNFKTELIRGKWMCYACTKLLTGREALVMRFGGENGRVEHIQVCDDECWGDWDHNYWLKHRIRRHPNNESLIKDSLTSMLPTKGGHMGEPEEE